MEFVLPLIGLAIMAPFVILAVKYSDKDTERMDAVWEGLSNRLGLELEKPRRMAGRVDGVDIVLEQVGVVIGGEPRSQTHIQAGLRAETIPSGLLLTREDFVSRTETKLKRDQDIELGIEGLDENVIVQGHDPDEVRSWASRGNVARGIAGIVASSWLFRVDQHTITLTHTKLGKDPEQMEQVVRMLAAAARALSELD